MTVTKEGTPVEDIGDNYHKSTTPGQQLQQGKCEECQRQSAIYQCPGCNRRTCSLECCKGHKERTGCTGKRNRGAFLPLCRMTDSTLRSDFFFLEEVMDQMPRNRKRTKLMNDNDNNNNNNKNHNHRQQSSASSSSSTNPMMMMSRKHRKLVQQAERRGILLQIMPPVMERHKSNTSWYCGPRDMITWKLEVVIDFYPDNDRKKICFPLSENEENIMDHICNRCTKEGISLTGISNYKLFLKYLPCSAKDPRYYELHPENSLKDILKGKTVIEHPTIYCVPEDRLEEFPIGTGKVVELPSSGVKVVRTGG